MFTAYLSISQTLYKAKVCDLLIMYLDGCTFSCSLVQTCLKDYILSFFLLDFSDLSFIFALFFKLKHNVESPYSLNPFVFLQ